MVTVYVYSPNKSVLPIVGDVLMAKTNTFNGKEILSEVSILPNHNIFKDYLAVDRVVYNDPATIVFWRDGTKTVVKCQQGDTYDKEKGLALCFMKKALGGKSADLNTELKRWLGTDKSGDRP